MNKRYLIEKEIEKVRGLDRKQLIFDIKRPGLLLIVHKQKLDKNGKDITYKSWYLNYRPKGFKHPQKILLGNAAIMSRAAAINKMKDLENQIYNKEDPLIIKKKLKEEPSLGSLIKDFKDKNFKDSIYSKQYIKGMESLFNVWVFQKPNDPAKFNKYFTYSIKEKKVSTIKTSHIETMYNAARSKSPYAANRLLAYLKVVFNWAIEQKLYNEKNPCKIKKKKLFAEKEANNILSKIEHDNLLRLALVYDERNGTINFDHYIQNDLEIIQCLAIAWSMLTGRRCSSEGFNVQFGQIDYDYKIINFGESKVGQKQYKLSDQTLKFLNAILRSRQKNIVIPEMKYKSKTVPERIKPSPWCNNDERSEYIFPSKFYGSFSKTPHITSVKQTWKKLLKLCRVKYIPLKQARHTFATLLLKKTNNLKAVQSQLGHEKITTTMKYAQLIDEDEFHAINTSDKKLPEVEVIELKK